VNVKVKEEANQEEVMGHISVPSKRLVRQWKLLDLVSGLLFLAVFILKQGLIIRTVYHCRAGQAAVFSSTEHGHK